MSILVSGSLAYDYIMEFPACFSDSILPEQLHQLNVAFMAPTMRREYGGCAGNIAYSLKCLGLDPIVSATLGRDGDHYRQRLEQLKINTSHVLSLDDHYTAQAFIVTDCQQQQITIFHPGAMTHAENAQLHDLSNVRLAIVAPNGKQAMINYAAQLNVAKIDWIFDPGQGLPMFSTEELLALIKQATYIVVNQYEAKLLAKRSGLDIQAIAEQVKALVVTYSAEGCAVYVNGEYLTAKGLDCEVIQDPTGCGDAFRAGLLCGIYHQMDWQTTLRLGNLMGAYKVGYAGAQNHPIDRSLIAQQFLEKFAYAF